LFVRSLTQPKVPENPTYGKLEQLKFIEKAVVYPEGGPEYELNTVDGKLPKGLPDIMPVYKFKENAFSYQAGKNASDDAALLGFTEEDLISDLKGKTYVWRNLETGSVLRIDIDTKDLVQSTNFKNQESEFEPNTLNEVVATKIAKEILEDMYRFEEDSYYPEGEQVVTLGIINNGTAYPTTSTRVAQVALIDFYRKVGEYNIYGLDPSKGLLRMIIRKPSRDANPLNTPIMNLEYRKFDNVSDATYPIISVSEAWKAVSSNKGVISGVKPNESPLLRPTANVTIDKILVNDVRLAYYEPPEDIPYLQPIYVFSGSYVSENSDGGEVYIYYPAIRGEYIEKPVEEQD
jgi:hypothetical protein